MSNINNSNTYTTNNVRAAPTVEQILLPTQVIERPVAIHENIRKELIEEIQPVINVEKLHTEVHQVTQPLFDKETRPVQIENRTLATEVLPDLVVEGRGARTADDQSSTRYLDTATVVIEKPAMYTEVERRQVIEEIQPVVYKETIVPQVIQETKPMYQKVVEGTVYTQETLASRGVRSDEEMRLEAERNAYRPSTDRQANVHERVALPTQIVQKPVAVHEEIRRETLEEIQPVVNVEKFKTEIHQITAPLYDKEVMPVQVERRTLAQEILPEVQVEGRGVRSVDDVSSVRYLDTKTTLIEKPTIINEIERTQVIEEVQPVVYKETVVPTVIRETKPVFQKIIEGPVYTHQTLAPQQLSGSGFHYPTQMVHESTHIEIPASVPVVTQVRSAAVPVQQEVIIPVIQQNRSVPASVIVQTPVVAPVVVAPIVQQPVHHRKEIIEETVTTTTTTTAVPVAAPIHAEKKHHSLFHRHHEEPAHAPVAHNSTTMHSSDRSLHAAPLGSSHSERVLPTGEKVIEDTVTTTTHSSTVVPARLV